MNAPLLSDLARFHDGAARAFCPGPVWSADVMAGWAVPEYSRNQVDRAGDVLISDETVGWEEYYKALAVINNWRAAHSYPLLNFRINLGRKLSSINSRAIVAQRIKRLPSIEAKLIRQTTQLSQMQDIGGCRAIVNNMRELTELLSSYKRSRFSHILKGEKNYVESPKQDGYRGRHLIYQYKSASLQNRAYDNLRIEIQLRTRMQHTWATAVEAVGIFTKEALKSNIGNKHWLRLFALMSSQIAAREKSKIIPNTPEQEENRIAEIRDLEGKLRAIATLEAYRATIVWAKDKVEKGSYFIMEYDYKQNNIRVQNFPKGQSQWQIKPTQRARAVRRAPMRSLRTIWDLPA